MKVSEADIQRTCTDWLLLDGWRVIHTDLRHLRGMGVQERGMADDLFIRYGDVLLLDETLWIEWKVKGGRAAVHQLAWHKAERARGAFTIIGGIDFHATIYHFMQWYRMSGLMRKNLR